MASVARGLLALVVAVPFYLAVLPLLLLLRLLGWLFLQLPCQLLAGLCRRSSGFRQAMRVEDAFMMMETATNHCNIIAAFEIDGPPLDLPALQALVHRTLVARPSAAGSGASDALVGPRWPRLQQRPALSCGCWFWEDMRESFDLSQHVREQPGVADEEALAELLARFQAEPMDLDRPLWDVVLVRPGTHSGGSTVMFRVHHAMGDGISLVRVILDALEGNGSSAAPAAVGHAGASRTGGPGALAELASCVLHAPLLAVEQLCQLSDRSSLRPSALSGSKRVALLPTVALQRVKDVARARGSTVSAVVAACFARALATSGSLGSEGGRAASLKFWVPISVRPSTGDALEMRNDLCFLLMPLHTGASSATSALAATDLLLKDMKSSNHAPALLLVIRAAMLLMPLCVAQPFLNWIGNKGSGVFSSVPGPTAPLHWGGSRVASLRFLVPQRSGIAVGLSAVSYAGSLRGAVSADAAALPEPQRVAEAWCKALEELEAAEEAGGKK